MISVTGDNKSYILEKELANYIGEKLNKKVKLIQKKSYRDINVLLNKINYYSNTVMKNAFQFRFDQVKTLKPKEVPILFMAGALARLKRG